jgi:hypothetical protein
MADPRYGKNFDIWLKLEKNGQRIWRKECTGYIILSNPHEFEIKEAAEVKSSINLLNFLLEKMILYFDNLELMENLSTMVQIRKISNIVSEIIVSAHPYTANEIPVLIQKMCDYHVYPNISLEDAHVIITRLNFSRYVFCVQYDTESGACLVVLKEVEPFYSHSDNTWLPQPREVFRKAYEDFNQPRTVVMTPAQCDALLSKEIKPRVEFMSVLPDGRIEVVFRRDAIPTVVPEIKILVEIDNLELKLKELKSSLK